MPRTKVLFFREPDGSVPLYEWVLTLPKRPQAKCFSQIERLGELGHEARRPMVDYLRDGIYELRVGLSGLNYRMLFFFHGSVAIVLSHGLIKERIVPPREIDAAIDRKKRFAMDPAKCSFEEPEEE